MNKSKVNLAKQIKKLIGKVYHDIHDPRLQSMNKGKFYHSKIVSAETTKFSNKCVEYIKSAYDSKIYDTVQIQNKLKEFVLKAINSNHMPLKEEINEFITTILLVPDRITYLFKLNNFNFQEEVKIDDLILITTGEKILNKVSLNNSYRNLIDDKDIILGISVVGDLNEQSYLIAYTKARRLANFLTFIDGPKRYCNVEELRQSQYINKNILGFSQENGWNLAQIIDDSDDESTFCKFNLKDDRYNHWLLAIKQSVYPELYPKLSEMRMQTLQAIDWVGKSMLNGDQTESFILLMIALETIIEQDPNELEKKVKQDYPNFQTSFSIEAQLTSVMDFLSVPNGNEEMANKGIKNAYGLRSKIIHNGIQLLDRGELNDMLSSWEAHLFTMICTILLEDNNWNTKYDLWKEANGLA